MAFLEAALINPIAAAFTHTRLGWKDRLSGATVMLLHERHVHAVNSGTKQSQGGSAKILHCLLQL